MSPHDEQRNLLDAVARDRSDIERRLSGLIDRVRRRFLVHGLGWLTAAVGAGLLVYFALDRFLDLPSLVRVLLSCALGTFLAFGVRRRLLYPLRKKFARDDIAIAVERKFPELRQRLITALQLSRRMTESGAGARGESEQMIAAVVDDAAEDIATLRTGEILDGKRTARVWGFAGTFAVTAILVLAANLAVTQVFFARMFGASTPYPRLTHLRVELPREHDEIRVALADRNAEVVMPAGGDLPVLVFAEGRIPREVSLQTSGGRGIPTEVTMSPRGEGRFRHVFRRVNRDFTFYASGGDDPAGDRNVSVRVVEPPRVGRILARVTFPSYTRTPPAEMVGGAIEALQGSKIELFVTATAEVTNARLHLIDSDVWIELTPQTMRDDSGVSTSYAGEFTVSESDRYQVLFVGATGVRNPHPGTYPIRALEDHKPIAQLTSPSSDDLNVVLPTALLPVSVRATDDFGIAKIVATTVAGKAGQSGEHTHEELLFVAGEDDEPTTETTVGSLLEVRALAPQPIAVGDVIVVSGAVTDIRQPVASIAELGKRHVHVVGPTDLARRVTNHFRRIRESVEKALELQTSRHTLLEEIRADLDSTTRIQDALITIEVGQGRVMSESRRFHRELMRSFDVHLFNRLEESLNAPKVVELYSRYHREHAAAEPQEPGFYREVLSARESGAIGPMEKTLDPILGMISSADELAHELCTRAVHELEQAQIATSTADVRSALDRVHAQQQTILERLRALRGQLDEWNEFQDVITQTRAIRDKQKDVRTRTETLQRGDK